MSDNLFDGFPEVSEKQWKQKLQYELNGASYSDIMLTHSSDDIIVKPFYHLDSYKQIPHSNKEIIYNICQAVFIDQSNIANKIALTAITNGADSILFKASKPFDINAVLKNIKNDIQLHFELQFLSENFISDLQQQTRNYRTFLNIDIIGNLCKNGNWYHSLQKDINIFTRLHVSSSPSATFSGVHAALYQNAGATIVQQVAFALAHANEYLNFNSDVLNLNVQFSIGSNYFFEIAKLRAFRYLWKLITDDAKVKSDLHIIATPSNRNKTLYDFNTNLVRTTSECMSAIAGGADTICNISHDSIFRKRNETGERLARNQNLILKYESNFNTSNQAVNGSYYIEALTKEISTKSLELFKDIEKNGGFLAQLTQGTIQKRIRDAAQKEQQLFDLKKITLTGINKHQNNNDVIKGEIEIYPFMKTDPRKTLIQPIIPKRLAEKLEQQRLKNET